MLNKKLMTIFSLALSTFVYSSAGFAAPCPGGHCGTVNAQVNQACISLGLSGRQFPVIGPNGGVCECPCSCVIAGTLIDTPDGAKKIESLAIGDLVFKPTGSSSSTEITRMLKSTVEKSRIHEIVFEGGKIGVSENHAFVTEEGRVKTAKNLKAGDSLLDAKGKKVKVISNTENKSFDGELYNLIIETTQTHPEDHVIVTNGVQSGDFLMQATLDTMETELDLREGKINLIEVP